MAHRTKPNTTRTNQVHSAHIVPSVLDEMEAMMRYPPFKRSLTLQRSILAKQCTDLTEEEDRENNAPRTRFRIAAIMEAQDQWLSHSIQQIRNRDEAEWAFEAVNHPFGDDTATMSMGIPLNLSRDAIQQYIEQRLRHEREKSGVKPIQHPRRPEVDQWKVHDLMREKDATPATVRDRLYGPYGRIDRRFARSHIRLSAAEKKRVKSDLKRIITAYQRAEMMIASLDSSIK